MENEKAEEEKARVLQQREEVAALERIKAGEKKARQAEKDAKAAAILKDAFEQNEVNFLNRSISPSIPAVEYTRTVKLICGKLRDVEKYHGVKRAARLEDITRQWHQSQPGNHPNERS